MNTRQTQEADAVDELHDIVEDMYVVANLLESAGRSKLSQEAAELAAKTSAFLARLKKELQ